MKPLEIKGEPLNTSMADLPAHVGEKLGPTDWIEMTQEQVNAFADLTGDYNYIHIDPEAAKSLAVRRDSCPRVLQPRPGGLHRPTSAYQRCRHGRELWTGQSAVPGAAAGWAPLARFG